MRALRTILRASAAFSIALLAALSSGCGGGGSGGGSEDDGPELSIADASLDEGDAGTANLAFTVTLSAADADDLTVDFATSAGSATAGTDYVSTSGTLTFVAGVTTQAIDVSVNGDLLDEADESFSVTLSQANGDATLGDANATGTIRDDDPLPVLQIGDAQATRETSARAASTSP